ncbi:MAG: ATP synthase F1 subunit delta [Acidimicrobiia bacterium]
MEGVTGSRVIDGYASALLAVGGAEGDVERITDEVFRIAHAFEGSEEFRSTMSDPRVPIELKQTVVSEILEGRASHVSIALINLLVGAGHTGEFVAVANRMAEMAAEREQATVAEVRSAVELDADTVARLEQKLAAVTGRRVKAKVVVDESIVGGVVTKIGDSVFDGSVRSRLQDLREAWG